MNFFSSQNKSETKTCDLCRNDVITAVHPVSCPVVTLSPAHENKRQPTNSFLSSEWRAETEEPWGFGSPAALTEKLLCLSAARRVGVYRWKVWLERDAVLHVGRHSVSWKPLRGSWSQTPTVKTWTRCFIAACFTAEASVKRLRPVSDISCGPGPRQPEPEHQGENEAWTWTKS